MTRTCDLRFRKPSLYPAELRDREPGEKRGYREFHTRAPPESLPRTAGQKPSLTASNAQSAEAFQRYFPITFTEAKILVSAAACLSKAACGPHCASWMKRLLPMATARILTVLGWPLSAIAE
jgi:hypothetical protein